MTNTSDPPTLAERLQNVPLGRLAVRLSLAQSTFAYAQTTFMRRKAMDEIDAIRNEYKRRGVPLKD